MGEVWLHRGGCTYEVTERSPLRSSQKLNPLWWLGNIDEPSAPDWYLPDHPLRSLFWWLRNPFHNLAFYVLGVADQNYTITGSREPVLDGPAPGGWKCHVLWTRFPRPYVSYQGKHLVFYVGWRFGGALGCKLNWKSNGG